jgi:hypothetical protein
MVGRKFGPSDDDEDAYFNVLKRGVLRNQLHIYMYMKNTDPPWIGIRMANIMIISMKV